jgi:lipopolysaccharide transport system permease protein
MQPTVTESVEGIHPPADFAPPTAEPRELHSTTDDAPKPSRIIIEAGRGAAQYWRDLWRYRELLYFLAWRDVIVHYKQTVIGVAWALLRPLATVAAFVLVFSKLAGLPSDGVPYALLVLAAMLPWQLFASALTKSSESLLGNSNLVSKVYFPRLILPLSAVVVSLVDFVITLGALAALMLWYQVVPTWRLLTMPIFVAIACTLALGVGLWFAALSVRYRDIRHVMPFLVQFGLYISPVGYSSSLVPEQYRLLFGLNPMVGVIDGFRWALFGAATIDPASFALSIGLIAAIVLSGVWFFRKTERTFADVI